MLNNNKAYIFVELDHSQRDANQMMTFVIPTMEFVVADEIINLQHVYGDPISEEVTEFFQNIVISFFFMTLITICMKHRVLGMLVSKNQMPTLLKYLELIVANLLLLLTAGFYFTSFANAYQNAINPKYEYISHLFIE